MGAICASGRNPDSIFDAILNRESSIAEHDRWDTRHWPCRSAGVIDAPEKELVKDRKLLKLIKKTDVFGIYAGEQALQDASVHDYQQSLDQQEAEQFADRFGIYVGTEGSGYYTQYDYFGLIHDAHGDLQLFGKKLDEKINPMWLLRNLPNNVLCHVGIRNNLKGANGCITDHSTSGAQALIEADAALRIGDADRAVAIGHDSAVEPQRVLYYHSLGLLADVDLKPFDVRRAGSILGEGAAALVLETEEAALARGARIHAEILGKGCSCEASGLLPIREDGDGLARAIQLALEQAELDAHQIGMVVCHGNGTTSSDRSEGAALRTIFGSASPPITGFKWAFGHLLAASGSIDAVLAIKALQRGTVPPIAPLEQLDPALEGLPIATEVVEPRSDTALVLSRGFGGRNTALVIRVRHSG
jgi:3-oxoacyl-[acyl-carrier-protein] synthase-1